MTIVVNDIAASPGGGLTVLKEFYNAVKRSDKNIKWVFLLSKPYVEETDNIKVVLLPKVKKHINRIIFDYITGAKLIESFKPSLVFSLQNTIVYGCKCKNLLYVHQSLPFQSIKKYSFFKKTEIKFATIQYLLGYIIKKSIKYADLTIVQTKWMETAVKKQCKTQKIIQVYPEIPKIPVSANYEVTNQFFYPTGIASYKNNNILINASKKLKSNSIKFKTVLTIDNESNDKGSNISFIGRIPIEKVYDYYRTSCLVFPSYIETFGYPLVEARAAGTIVLAANTKFSKELLEGYKNAYFFDPFNEDELVDLMTRVATGKIIRSNSPDINNTALINGSWDKLVLKLAELISENKL